MIMMFYKPGEEGDPDVCKDIKRAKAITERMFGDGKKKPLPKMLPGSPINPKERKVQAESIEFENKWGGWLGGKGKDV